MPITPGSLQASVIIPTYNRGELLLATVDHFLKQQSKSVEFIIIDQSDTPSQTLHEMAAANRQLQYLHIKEKGLPNARNVGFERSSGRILIFCDDDTIPEDDFITAHVEAYTAPWIGAVAGRVILQDHPPTNTAAFGTIRRFDFRIIGEFNSSRRKRVDHFQGCNFSVRRQIFSEGARSDKRFGGTAHLEECDLALQITKKGYQILFEPGAALVHLVQSGGGCRMPDMGQWLYWYGHNYMLLHLKHGWRILFPFFLMARLTKFLVTAARANDVNLLLKGIHGLIAGGKTYLRPNNHAEMT